MSDNLTAKIVEVDCCPNLITRRITDLSSIRANLVSEAPDNIQRLTTDMTEIAAGILRKVNNVPRMLSGFTFCSRTQTDKMMTTDTEIRNLRNPQCPLHSIIVLKGLCRQKIKEI